MDNKHLFEQLAINSEDLFFYYDYDTKHFECLSDGVQPFLGLSRKEINQQPEKLLQLIEKTDTSYIHATLLKLKEKKGLPLTTELRLYLPHYTTKWVRVKVYTAAQAAEASQLFIIAEDISQRKEHELSLMAMKEQKDIVIQILGHDLRAPLNTISLSMTLIGKEVELEGNNKLKKFIGIVESTCRNSLEMIQEVLRVEFLESQQLDLKKTRIDICSRIQNQVDTLRLLDKTSKSILFTKNTEALYTSVDSMRLMLIVENLLTNAYKFTAERGRIEVNLEDREENILISVADNGIGIPEKLKPLIFDKFTKARRKGTQGEQTVGLGMHLIKTMVDQLDGKISFESQEGKGTTFFVELPK